MITLSEVGNSLGLVITCDGDLDVKEINREMKDLQKHFPGLASWFFAVADLSTVGQLSVLAADLDALVQHHNRLAMMVRPGLHLAVIAKTDLAFGVARMWQAASEPTGWNIFIFRERRAAEAWLRHSLMAAHSLELPPLWPEDASASAKLPA